MPGQNLVLRNKGLFTNANEHSATPGGAMLRADNVVINAEDVVEPRRGFDTYGYAFGTTLDRANKMLWFGSNLLVNYGTSLAYSTGAAFSDYSGSYSAPSGFKMRAVEANKNLYLTTSEGVKKIDAVAQTPETCGVPKAINVDVATTGASGFLANNYVVNYRVVWGVKDANSNTVYGAASQLVPFTNSAGGSRNTSLTIYIPSGITTSHFFQVYRSAQIDNTSGTVSASEELGLVYEDNPASGDITAGYITITDITTDALRGATCYVSPSQGGILGNNDQPPLAKSIAVFKNRMFFGNTTSRHRYFLTLLGTGSSGTVLQVDDTVVIGGVTYTAKASENVASRQFKVFTGGTSVANDIRDTCLSLVKVVNGDATASVYGFYLSGNNDLPGKMMFEEVSIGGSAFSMAASRTTCFSPASLPTSGTAETSTNDEWENAVFYSKLQEPEAVPLLNYVRVGSADKAILQMVAGQNALFIFKEDGIFRLVGDNAPFSVDLLDDTAILIGSETPARVNNQIMCLTTQGVVAVSDAGVSVISRPIEDSLTALYGSPLSAVRTYAFGVGYETDRKYILFTPTASSDTYCNIAYVYNVFTETWTRWVMDVHSAAVGSSDDKLYIGTENSNSVLKERKAFDFTDYVDYYSTETITSISGTYDIYMSNADNVEVGDLLYQSTTVYGIVTAVYGNAGYVTVGEDMSFAAGSVTVFKAIETAVKWVADTASNPGALKHYSEVAFLFKRNFYGYGTCTFTSDMSPGEVTISVTGDTLGTWGTFPWGESPWGGDNLKTPVRVAVSRPHRRCSQLSIEFTHRWAYADWQLNGLSLVFTPGSTRISG